MESRAAPAPGVGISTPVEPVGIDFMDGVALRVYDQKIRMETNLGEMVLDNWTLGGADVDVDDYEPEECSCTAGSSAANTPNRRHSTSRMSCRTQVNIFFPLVERETFSGFGR